MLRLSVISAKTSAGLPRVNRNVYLIVSQTWTQPKPLQEKPVSFFNPSSNYSQCTLLCWYLHQPDKETQFGKAREVSQGDFINISPLFSTGAEFESSETDAVIVILEDFSVWLVRLLQKLLKSRTLSFYSPFLFFTYILAYLISLLTYSFICLHK